ncbi:Na(+)/H(+) antiporter subunit E [Methanimicrococcus hongohii]|uniref:Na(+)/H(+) antiporter subunit E n=1 Tax=Methanimicrococcus hongohii TaxID=3028295 RepID=A0AA96ZSW4_9EURY|nr:Na+/H+ antiporter subunit E [Methanimicrococcus sp. Hf6]WNY23855.1 Na(+)/H(+) antiporter subunit E [Methanimicrococcus sp. Hf6]
MIRIMKYTTYLLMGFVWVFLSGNTSIGSYMLGVFFSILILYPFKDMFTFTDSTSDMLRKIPAKIKYTYVLFREIVKANFFMVYKILQPKLDIRPGIIAYPFTTSRSISTTMLANTISLTPGTLIMDVHVKNKTLKGPGIFYVHSIYVESPKEVRDSIHEDLEEVVLEAFE